MNHYPETKSVELLPELRAELERIRAKRGFNPETYLTAKVEKVAAYLNQHGLKGVVLGMSGGVDSAVVLGILRETQKRALSSLRIVPLALPTHVAEVGQLAATDRIARLGQHWGIPIPICNLQSPHFAISLEMECALEHTGSSWARGQLTSLVRTPALYYAATLLTDQGCPAVVVGTTNRDEGAYLGYVGKASDGMVDIQLIADLHKSEVYKLARHLGVTEEIISAIPSGEMHDGRVDEEVFGAPYDFVELFLDNKCSEAVSHNGWFLPSNWKMIYSEAARVQYTTWAKALEELHNYNAHKYLAGSPAVHLNVLESAVPGGWKE